MSILLPQKSHLNRTEKPIKPVLRWAGSKRSLVPRIQSLFPESFNRYIEPFAGSACVFFAVSPAKAILNDNNPGLISFYKDLIKSPVEMYREFRKIERNAETYYSIRGKFNKIHQSFEKSVLFYYLNRNCFNGIFRTNVKGEFNVPYAERRVASYLEENDINIAVSLLKRSILLCDDFEKVCLNHAKAGDFVYLDPPYYVPSQRTFREYSATPFSRIDFDRLETLLVELHKRGVMFVLSYPDCDLARALAKPWSEAFVSARRRIASLPSSRGYTRELVIRNFS